MYMNQGGWPVVAPYRYAGETAGKVKQEEVIGTYKYVNHGKAISAAINKSQSIQLQKDGTITGAISGTWERTGDNVATIVVDGTRYDGVFTHQWEPLSASYVMTFSALSTQGVAIWGSKIPDKT
jgi:arabinan endo-1,5-alpha-L-arabinosidase